MGNTDSALGHPLRAQLEEACRRSSAAYAVYWAERDGALVAAAHYHVPERLTVLRDDELTYPEACRGVQLEAGVGPVGRAFLGGDAELVSVGALPAAQARLAKEFNIRSMACTAWKGGVLEVGTDRLWKGMPSLPTVGAVSTEAKLTGLGEMWRETSGSTDCSSGLPIIEGEESAKRVACF